MCIPMPLESGTDSNTDGETWFNWWLFPPLTDEQVEDVLSYHGIERRYGRPGQVFLCAPQITRQKEFTLIRQYGGWDI